MFSFNKSSGGISPTMSFTTILSEERRAFCGDNTRQSSKPWPQNPKDSSRRKCPSYSTCMLGTTQVRQCIGTGVLSPKLSAKPDPSWPTTQEIPLDESGSKFPSLLNAFAYEGPINPEQVRGWDNIIQIKRSWNLEHMSSRINPVAQKNLPRRTLKLSHLVRVCFQIRQHWNSIKNCQAKIVGYNLPFNSNIYTF